MTIREIIVHMDDSPGCGARLEAAMQVAADHDAHLIGLYAIPLAQIPGYMDAQIPVDLLQMQTDRLTAIANKVDKSFNEATQRTGVSAEWRCLEGDAAEVLADHGRYADLIIVGQYSREDIVGSTRDEIADQVVLSSGRPVLVIPENFNGSAIGTRVMIGWDGGQMATRALHDALPFLAKAEQVSVMTVISSSDDDNASSTTEIDVSHHLARHNIKAEADHITSSELSVGDQLLARAADMSADLIVTGAYGHSRWKELILGGVTRHLLDTMPVPVLMSH